MTASRITQNKHKDALQAGLMSNYYRIKELNTMKKINAVKILTQ